MTQSHTEPGAGIPRLNPQAEAEAFAARNGFIITAEHRAKIAELQRQEAERQAALSAVSGSSFVSRFNALYPRVLQFLSGLGDVVLTFAQTLIVNAGVPLILVLLIVVEQQRVFHGIMTFETSEAFANFGSTALVLANLVSEFMIRYIEHTAGYKPPAETRYSLRIWAGGVLYWLGLGTHWKPRETSPAARFHSLMRLLTVGVMFLALAGSMRSMMEKAGGQWLQAFWSVVTQSSLPAFTAWVSGLIFAFLAVRAVQVLSAYVAARTILILGNMQTAVGATAEADQTAIHQVGAQYIVAVVNEFRTAKKAAAKAPNLQIGPNLANLAPVSASAPVQRASPKMNKTVEYLKANPAAMAAPIAEVAAAVGVSDETVRNARARVLQEAAAQSQNNQIGPNLADLAAVSGGNNVQTS